MFKQNKIIKIGLIVVIIVIISATGVWILTKKTQPEENGFNQDRGDGEEEIILKSKIIEEQVIASNGEGFPHFTLQEGGEELVLATYNYTIIPGTDVEEGTGFLLFRYDEEGKIKKIWKEEFTPFRETTFSEENGLKDLNSDGAKEFLIYVLEPRGYVGNLWIYKWQENKLNILNPLEDKDGKLTRIDFEVSSYSNLEFIDIEGDNKIEISLLFPKGIRLGPGPEDFRKDIYKRIYKWDGTEEPYYLWKEEKIGEEKPTKP